LTLGLADVVDREGGGQALSGYLFIHIQIKASPTAGLWEKIMKNLVISMERAWIGWLNA
jgi:hypothetical protein